ncbi:F0F1 ATP synthase subunit B family protein [Rickettsia endosymbiont of Cardiosporidium cionae]|uniref:F0F1 ATP synthase subunit B family protein n=1 Tax=Rickettsia endosymbiont of Cardiosporidium cionae TaxID=2777155 RepID=UPI001895FF77|nr:hypothetical protein [Rickettsia endosymbiont of Cardiosporidium cionae]KAF8818584.1 hypothetical protein IHI24_000302 [Rickettsia endosymbiont of Cardiosporidium cionae]
MPQLDSSNFISQIFWLLILFTLLYAVVSKFIIPRFLQILQKRKDSLLKHFELTKFYNDRILLLQNQHKCSVDAAHDEAQLIYKNSVLQLEEIKKDKHQKLVQEIIEYKKNLDNVISDFQSEFANHELNMCFNLSMLILQKITTQRIDDKKLYDICKKVTIN